MEEIYLTVKDVAELKGCTERYIQLQINKGNINADCINGQAKGKGGMQYRIPLSGLEKRLQSRFKRRLTAEKKAEEKIPNQKAEADTDYEKLSEEERAEITMWKKILSDWQSFRTGRDNKAEADETFISISNIQQQLRWV